YHGVASRVGRVARGLLTHQRFAGDRVLALGEPLELLVAHLALQPPIRREPAMPRAPDRVATGVVVIARVDELVRMVPIGLRGTEWLGDGQHGTASYLNPRSSDELGRVGSWGWIGVGSGPPSVRAASPRPPPVRVLEAFPLDDA